ncbi:MAG: DUF4430 domain-containing protein [Lachnospiraceae bacterium]|nr:DUF4430 domain-containing protein [Lachnospiraceae bacterium]
MRKNSKFIMRAGVLLVAGVVLAGGIVLPAHSGAISVLADEEKDTVQVIIENTTWSKDDGAAWDGVVTAEVELKEGYTGLDVLREAAESNDMELVSLESLYGGYYVSSIGGVAEKGAAEYAGWLYTFNTAAANVSVDAYKQADGSLSDGDVIRFLYSKDGGYDLGFYDGGETSKGISGLEVEGGTLSSPFSADSKEYKLLVEEGTKSVKIIPTATLGDEDLIITSGEKTYKRGAAVPVEDGTVITVKTVKTNYDADWNPVTVESVVTLTVSEKKVLDPAKVNEDLLTIQDAALTGEGLAYGSEWYVINLARAGKLSDEKKAAYLESVKKTVAEKASTDLAGQNPTENARLILALTAIEEDPTDVGGVNLLNGIAGLEDIKAKGINAAAFALLALDSNKYEASAAEGKTQATREALIDYIASCELENGGFDYTGTAETADPDMTSMVLYALAPYSDQAKVKEIIDRCVDLLSKAQGEDGSFVSWGSANSNSTAQVIIALCSLGIDPAEDARFIKNGHSAMAALTTYYRMGKGAQYLATSDDADFYSNYQMSQALQAAARRKAGEPSFFNMTKANEAGATGYPAVTMALLFIALAGSGAAVAAASRKKA